MAKNKVTEDYNSEKTSDEALQDLLKTNLSQYKSPNGNNCPWRDGQELEYDRLVPIHWENDRGVFHYIAIAFKGTTNRFAVQSCTRNGEGYKSGDSEKDNDFQPFVSVGGLHDLCDGVTSYDEAFLTKLHNWLKDGTLKIKLTTYYVTNSYGNGRIQKVLMNIVKAKPAEEAKAE
jgi:hypothetical protein